MHDTRSGGQCHAWTCPAVDHRCAPVPSPSRAKRRAVGYPRRRLVPSVPHMSILLQQCVSRGYSCSHDCVMNSRRVLMGSSSGLIKDSTSRWASSARAYPTEHVAAACGAPAGLRRTDPASHPRRPRCSARAATSFNMTSGRQQIAVVGALKRHVGWGASFFIVVYSRLLCILARLLPPPPGAHARSAAWTSTGVTACSPSTASTRQSHMDVVDPGKVATRTCPPSPPHPALFSTPAQLPSALAPERCPSLCWAASFPRLACDWAGQQRCFAKRQIGPYRSASAL